MCDDMRGEVSGIEDIKLCVCILVIRVGQEWSVSGFSEEVIWFR